MTVATCRSVSVTSRRSLPQRAAIDSVGVTPCYFTSQLFAPGETGLGPNWWDWVLTL
jgi:hypothetical protein